ncbi:hypothetical protein CJA_2269 [Cellvibrio japonicus Ueda107]|uniref:Uncharacterized protein n=1 Tax=Cellvibrio japonicus (strain Ueda107) TaxID=498211 RepID=B3PJF7_CELJU|nr:hypothetical protein CJA_2269 [Cellvibrio japonicus Ueda107]
MTAAVMGVITEAGVAIDDEWRNSVGMAVVALASEIPITQTFNGQIK